MPIKNSTTDLFTLHTCIHMYICVQSQVFQLKDRNVLSAGINKKISMNIYVNSCAEKPEMDRQTGGN